MWLFENKWFVVLFVLIVLLWTVEHWSMTKSLTYKGRVITDLEVDNLDYDDYPDFCDAYFYYGVYQDTMQELTDQELEEITDNCRDSLHAICYDIIHWLKG